MTGNGKRIDFRLHIIKYEGNRLVTGINEASLHLGLDIDISMSRIIYETGLRMGVVERIWHSTCH